MSEVGAIARMNIAALDDATLAELRRFFAAVRDHGTEDGAGRAPGYLQAIGEEFERRGKDPDGMPAGWAALHEELREAERKAGEQDG